MSVRNDIHLGATPITVAGSPATNSPPARGKPSPGHPTPGNANAHVRRLSNIKPDPKRAISPDIDNGILLLRNERTTLEGQKELENGIDAVVAKLAGANNLDEYAKVKLATDEILRAYSGRKDLTARDKAAVVDGVNAYLRRKVVDGFHQAKTDAQLDQAKKVAVRYVSDPGPYSMSWKDWLNYITDQLLMAGVNEAIVNDVIARCEASKKK
jgi:hypothetical protein